ncbi:MAG: hypothetical protein IT580_09200, partial [Verrucomicrobiales bacterium]|nr:hypothetical protein [Verrucomicrobiales bacterium]
MLLVLGTARSFAASWTNPQGGAWTEAANWSGGQVPMNTEAVIDLPGTYGVVLDSDLSVTQFLLESPAATLGGSGTLTIVEGFTWRSGILGGNPLGAVIARGDLFLTGFNGVGGRSLSRALLNFGSASWNDSAPLQLGNGGTISNAASGTFEISGDARIDAVGGSRWIWNAGTLRRIDSGTLDLGVELRNSGRVEIESGTLVLRQGSQHSGSLHITNLAGLVLAGGAHAFTTESKLTGAGGLTISGGTTTLGGEVDLRGPYLFRGGTVVVSGAFQAITNLLTVDGANVTFTGAFRCVSNVLEVVSGSARFEGGGLLEPSSLRVGPAGRLEGSTPILVRGPLTLEAGAIAGTGTLIARDGLMLGDGGLRLAGRALVNGGVGRWRGAAGTLSMESGAAITNLAGATFDLELDPIVADSGGAIGFINEGQFRKTGGTGTALFTTPFSNPGTLETLSGGLTLRGGGKHSGTFQVGEGTQLSLGGNHTLEVDSTMSGLGTLAVLSGTADFGGVVDVRGSLVFSGGVANLTGRYNAITNLVMITGGKANFSGSGVIAPGSLVITNLGILGGVDPVSVRGPMRWGAGRMEGSGPVVAEQELEMIGGSLTMSGRALVNRGAGRWRGTAGT